MLARFATNRAWTAHIAYVRTRLNQAFQPEPIGETWWEAAELEGSSRALN
jgi:hypothetical protein